MKKIIYIMLVLSLISTAVFSGCSDKQSDTDGLSEVSDTENNKSSVDIDLTALSSTMVYTEVYNMVTTPDNYLGKTIKVRGAFNASYFEDTDSYYYYIVVADTASCCQQGLEFIWEGEHTYPDDYPENGTEIEIVGVYGQYTELNVTYNYLSVENIKTI